LFRKIYFCHLYDRGTTNMQENIFR
jgi:hypothetical protein